MYYEDSEWCYRARLLGWLVAAVPQAVVFHALGGRPSSRQNPGIPRQGINPEKQQRVVYGRLHFITRLLGSASWLRFVTGYFIEDLARWALALLRGQSGLRRNLCAAWKQYLNAFPALRQENRLLRAKRAISDHQLLKRQVTAEKPVAIPPPLVRQGIPLLTWELVRSVYGPYLLERLRSTRQAVDFLPASLPPELAWVDSRFNQTGSASLQLTQFHKPGLLGRARMIYRLEGGQALLERLAKTIQHALR